MTTNIETTVTEDREPVTTTVDGEQLYAGDTFECSYCNAEVPAEFYDASPDIDDNAGWAELADAHSSNGCEWVETRAHRLSAAK